MKKTSRRGFGKQLGLALGALPVASLTTKVVEGQRRRKFDGDPITVGGGGTKRNPRDRRKLPPPPPRPIYLDFKDTVYRQQGSILAKKTFQHMTPTTYMRSLVVMINGVTFNLTSLLPPNGECRIELKGKGNAEDFDIWGEAPMRISFDPGRYPKTGGVYTSNDQTNYIKKVIVDTPLGHFERKNLTDRDEVRIYTSTV